jgi:hypothetical protein
MSLYITYTTALSGRQKVASESGRLGTRLSGAGSGAANKDDDRVGVGA